MSPRKLELLATAQSKRRIRDGARHELITMQAVAYAIANAMSEAGAKAYGDREKVLVRMLETGRVPDERDALREMVGKLMVEAQVNA